MTKCRVAWIACAPLVCAAFVFAGCASESGGGASTIDSGTPGSSFEEDSGAASGDAASQNADSGSRAEIDAGGASECVVTTTDAKLDALATASTADEYALTIDAAAASATSWGESGNEALVLEIRNGAYLIGHMVLHQGADRFSYAMHLGALAAGDVISVRVSPLSAPAATKSACISKITLTPASAMGAAAEGMTHAPIVKWPKQKSFDDLPILLGWSKAQKNYQLTYTNENGGTTALCGGGARGVRSEIARWGRGLDMEGIYGYGGAGHFERCTGTVAPSAGVPRMENAHPVVYYGDGHNRLFESRGGYGQACGTGSDAMADGALAGWNTSNPGNDPSQDDAYSIVLRPLPVDMDALGVTQFGGRREAIVDTYAPWLYRLTNLELKREGKIDDTQTFDMTRYLMVDVYAMDVGGSGDATCGPSSIDPSIGASASGGFVLRANAGTVVSSGPQMTADYFGGENNVKRIAIPLAPGVAPADITGFTFDAYDDDGIYFMAIGDAFVAEPSGSNGATLTYVHKGKTSYGRYVDDDSSGCNGGANINGGVSYPCAGSFFSFPR